MKHSSYLAAILALPLLAGVARSEDVPFPAGDFETDPMTEWTATGSATFEESGGNNFGRVAPAISGSGNFRATVPATFAEESLYVVSFDVSSTQLLSLGADSFGIQVLDGDDNIVAELTQEQLVELLGINLSIVNDLTLDLNNLDSILSVPDSLLATLRDLLESLSLADDDALFAAIQELLDSLVGANESLVAEVVMLLEDLQDGTLDPGSLDDLDIADLLDLDPSDPIVQEIEDLLAFIVGNEGPVENLVAILEVLLGSEGDLADLTLITDLLETLLGEGDLVEGVTNVLNLDLVEDILGSLTEDDLRGLLGLLNPMDTDFQTVRLLFTTDDPAPPGNIDIRLLASALVTVGMQVDFDNVTVERFDLFATPNETPGDTNITNTRPLIRARLQRKIRVVNRPRVRIRGIARAFGEDNFIRVVKVAVRGKGTTSAQRKFRKKGVRGTENWVARVRVPVSSRTRVLLKATDATGKTSVTSLVRVQRRR